MDEMLLLCLGVHNHVVQVNEGVREVQFSQTVLHEAMKCRGHVAQAVGHAQELIDAHAPYCEGSVLS